ncbi:MAG: hypothetical protein U0974_04440 [Gemmatimonadales bacterium]|nr:hypothetical protein [Gemmatimonadales bacterium]
MMTGLLASAVVPTAPAGPGRSASAADEAVAIEQPAADQPGPGDPPPSDFAAVLAGLMLPPAVQPVAPPVTSLPDAAGLEVAEGGTPEPVIEAGAAPREPGRPTVPGRPDPQRSAVAEAVLRALAGFLPGQVEGQAIAQAARTAAEKAASPEPLTPAGVGTDGVVEIDIAVTALKSTTTSTAGAGDESGSSDATIPPPSGRGQQAASADIEPPAAPRRGLAAVAALVRQSLTFGTQLPGAPIAATPEGKLSALPAGAAASGDSPPVASGVLQAAPRGGVPVVPVEPAESAPDDGSFEGEGRSQEGAARAAPLSIGGTTPGGVRTPATVSVVAAMPQVADVTPPPTTGTPGHTTVELSLGDGVSGRLRIAVRGEVIHATILADAVHAALLERELPGLRQALLEQGFEEAHLTVRVPPATTSTEVTPGRREAERHDRGGQDPRPDRRQFNDDDRQRERRHHPTKEEFQ